MIFSHSFKLGRIATVFSIRRCLRSSSPCPYLGLNIGAAQLLLVASMSRNRGTEIHVLFPFPLLPITRQKFVGRPVLNPPRLAPLHPIAEPATELRQHITSSVQFQYQVVPRSTPSCLVVVQRLSVARAPRVPNYGTCLYKSPTRTKNELTPPTSLRSRHERPSWFRLRYLSFAEWNTSKERAGFG